MESEVRMRLMMGLVLIATVVAPAVAQERATEEKTLREMWNQFEQVYNQSDAKKVASLYAPDGDRINPAGEVAHGRAEVEKQYQAIFERRRTDPLHGALSCHDQHSFLEARRCSLGRQVDGDAVREKRPRPLHGHGNKGQRSLVHCGWSRQGPYTAVSPGSWRIPSSRADRLRLAA